MKKLAIVSTHPIQYNAPWFKLLAERSNVELMVFYTWSQTKTAVKDKTFGKEIEWDIPLLEGYNYEFVENVSKQPGSNHFFGIDNPTLINKLQTYQPEAILFFGWNFKSHLKAMRYFHGKVPVWFRGDSTLLDEAGGFKTRMRRLVLKQVYRYVDKALYVGMANKSYFLKHGLKINQLIYAPHAIDNTRFIGGEGTGYSQRSVEWRQKLGYNATDIVVLFSGKFEAKKQPAFLIQAIIEANQNSKHPLQLLLVGHGPQEAEIKSLAKDYDFITFIPFVNQSQMPEVYRLGDVFCLPSKGPGETWGLAVNEAMASGRPVIVSDKVGCAKDLVTEARGWLFRHDDYEALLSILKTLKKEVIAQKGQLVQSFIKNYSFEHIVNAVETKL